MAFDRRQAIGLSGDARWRAAALAAATFLAILVVSGIVDVGSIVTEYRRMGRAPELRELVAAEVSSRVVWFALFWPILALVRHPKVKRLRLWKQAIALLAIAPLVSVVHVSMMVALRKVLWWGWGRTYEFASSANGLFGEFVYELRKDVQTTLLIWLIVAVVFHFRDSRALRPTDERLVLKLGAVQHHLEPAKFVWAKAAGNYVEVCVDGEVSLVRSSLARVLEQLEQKEQTAVRVHRSWLVNPNRIRQVRPSGSGDWRLCMDSGEEIPGSRRYRDAFLKHTT
ncbi:MAG: LytTR family DNA-binding domain-containing protein [Myxococcota bacterium]